MSVVVRMSCDWEALGLPASETCPGEFGAGSGSVSETRAEARVDKWATGKGVDLCYSHTQKLFLRTLERMATIASGVTEGGAEDRRDRLPNEQER